MAYYTCPTPCPPPYYSTFTVVPAPSPNLNGSHGYTPPFYSTFTNIPLQPPNPYTSYVSSSNPYTYGSSVSAGSLGYYNSIHPYSQPIGYQNSNSSHASQQNRRSEMVISVFDGTQDAYWWVLCTEKYFNARETSEAKKMAETATAMRGPALKWWLWWSQRHPLASWDSFTTAFLWHFKLEFRDVLPTPDEEQEPDSELMSSVLTASEAFLLPTDQIELASLTVDLVEPLVTVAPFFEVHGTTPQTKVQHRKWSTEAITSPEQQRSFHTTVRAKKPTIPSPTPPPPKPPDSVLVTPSPPPQPPAPYAHMVSPPPPHFNPPLWDLPWPPDGPLTLVSETATQTRFSPSNPHQAHTVQSGTSITRVIHAKESLWGVSPASSHTPAHALSTPSDPNIFSAIKSQSLNENTISVPHVQATTGYHVSTYDPRTAPTMCPTASCPQDSAHQLSPPFGNSKRTPLRQLFSSGVNPKFTINSHTFSITPPVSSETVFHAPPFHNPPVHTFSCKDGPSTVPIPFYCVCHINEPHSPFSIFQACSINAPACSHKKFPQSMPLIFLADLCKGGPISVPISFSGAPPINAPTTQKHSPSSDLHYVCEVKSKPLPTSTIFVLSFNWTIIPLSYAFCVPSNSRDKPFGSLQQAYNSKVQIVGIISLRRDHVQPICPGFQIPFASGLGAGHSPIHSILENCGGSFSFNDVDVVFFKQWDPGKIILWANC